MHPWHGLVPGLVFGFLHLAAAAAASVDSTAAGGQYSSDGQPSLQLLNKQLNKGRSRLLQEEAKPPQIPPYIRLGGNSFQFWVPEKQRLDGISYLGAAERLRIVLDRLHRGGSIKVASIGGSITAGSGAYDGTSWPLWVENYLSDTYGADKITHQWSAVGGTTSAYMSACHNMHVPKDADLLFVEYSVNDAVQPHRKNGDVESIFENGERQLYERLLRKLLNYPKAPAVVLVHSYAFNGPHKGVYWSNAERDFAEFGLYYGLPSISVKGAAYHFMRQNVSGYRVDVMRAADPVNTKGQAFYFDQYHPDGNTGTRVYGELAITLIQQVINGTQIRPISPAEIASAQLPIPEPMIPGNKESLKDKCFIGTLFTQAVSSKDGWEWINESKTDRPKFGFVSNTTGSTLRLLTDSTATAGSGEVLVQLAYLRSYENMGSASVQCESGCTCTPTILQGHTSERTSLLHLHDFWVSQAAQCTIAITVLAETQSGGHKVKVAGIIVSEEAGRVHAGVRNSGAVEYVSDISARSKGGTFDIRNHA